MRFTDLLDAVIFWPVVLAVWFASWMGWLSVGIRLLKIRVTLADLIEWTGTCTIAGLRISGEKGEVFQAGAHIYTGLLIGMWMKNRDRFANYDRSLSAQIITLCLIEIACFGLGLMHGR